MDMDTGKVGIVIGSKSDFQLIKTALDKFRGMAIPFEVTIASAHRSQENVISWARQAAERGVEVIVAVAGGSAHLAGVIAANTTLPVIAVPLDRTHLRGIDALYSSLQMPVGTPLAVVGINCMENALLLAAEILAIKYRAIRARLEEFRRSLTREVEQHNQDLAAEFPEYAANILAPQKSEQEQFEEYGRDAGIVEREFEHYAKSIAGELGARAEAAEPGSEPTRKESKGIAEPSTSRKPKVLHVDPVSPDYASMEQAAAVLLNGGIVAFPTDTVYGVGVDATNASAVRRLYTIKKRSRNKAIPIFIHNRKMLKYIVKTVPGEVEKVMEELWPGSLTVVLRKYSGVLREVSETDTIGVRIPDSMIPLGLVSLINRPLATTSANLSGQPPATTAEDVLRHFGDSVDLILDGGRTSSDVVSTVLSVVEEPYRILREGTITRESLVLILGEKLETL
jgi:5-(carboxyamino)imidazole ribonucleotide mutase